MTMTPVFISYSRRDTEFLDELRPLLQLLGESAKLHFWDDRQIQPGDRWEPAIQQSMSRARLALLLVSTHYLGSDYVKTQELPQLMRLAKENRVRVLWVAVTPTLWELTELVHFQAVNDPNEPLSTMTEGARQQELVRICRTIKKTLEAESSVPASRGDSAAAKADPVVVSRRKKVAILYKRHAQPDEQVMAFLDRELRDAGHEVFIDRHVKIGQAWAARIEEEIKNADAVIPVVSNASFSSEMLAYEVQVASDANVVTGRPAILPVRLNPDGPIQGELGALLAHIQYASWKENDDQAVLQSVLDALAGSTTGELSTRIDYTDLLDPTGAEPLDSRFYIERDADRQLKQFVARWDGIARIHGPRQSGKSSLLARVMHRARESGVCVLFCDLQSLTGDDLRSLETFYLAMLRRFGGQLSGLPKPTAEWDSEQGANNNLEAYLKNHILNRGQRVLIAIDEADRLFDRAYCSDYFGLARTWFNNRATYPAEAWPSLSQVYAYATEAAVFISNLDQSPFNVGRDFPMQDFSEADIRELDRLHGNPLKGELRRFTTLLGGHPYLVRRALFELTNRNLSVAQLEEEAVSERGPFGDHLRRLLVVLAAGGPALDQLVESVLATAKGGRPGSARVPREAFARARASGLLRGDDANPQFRCGLYERYIALHRAMSGV